VICHPEQSVIKSYKHAPIKRDLSRYNSSKLNTLETKMGKISHNKITTLFWRKKAKINLHQNFPIYGFFYLHGGRTILKDARNCETLQFATHLITDEINEMRTTRWAPYMLQTMVLYNCACSDMFHVSRSSRYSRGRRGFTLWAQSSLMARRTWYNSMW
jgi:hypothetical protein